MKQDLKHAYRTAYLVAGFIRQTLTEEEKDELDTWILVDDENMRLFGELTDEKNLEASLEWYRQLKTEKALEASKLQLQFKTTRKNTTTLKYAIAASVLIGIVALVYVFGISKQKEPATPDLTIASVPMDLQPGTNFASLQTGDGQIIQLKDIKDSTITGQAVISNGSLKYQSATTANVEMHLLQVPRKAHYMFVLPDGTKVWLNAESSIRYPSAFAGRERVVSVTGETYFEVAHDAAKPFIVMANGLKVKALGTQFNINAYADEPGITATLAEGSIQVNDMFVLTPGQQAMLKAGQVEVVSTDVEPVIAWKNDQFRFKDAGIDELMRKVQRWYDAEIIYHEKPDYHFNGTIDRSVPVSMLLALLEKTGRVHFRVEGKTIHVMH